MPNIRPVSIEDLDEMVKIEAASFSAPFTRRMFEGIISNQPPFAGFVIEDGGALAGYIFFSAAVDEMELLSVAVDEKFRRKGYARRLIQTMFQKAAAIQTKRIFLEVRPSNTAARGLYDSVGFLPVGVRKGYYADNKEDAIVMQKILEA